MSKTLKNYRLRQDTIEALARVQAYHGLSTEVGTLELLIHAEEKRIGPAAATYRYTGDVWGDAEMAFASLDEFQAEIDELYEVNDWGEAPELDDNGEEIWYCEGGERVYVGEIG